MPESRSDLPIAGVLLAAGGSSRMGPDRPKQLVELGGRPLVRRAAGIALASRCDAWFAVLGARADAVRAALDGLDLVCVVAEDWADGMSRSIRLGVAVAADDARGFGAVLLALADQPDVTAAHFDALIDAWRASGAAAVGTGYAGTVGAPALFDRSRFAELLALEGDRGARALLRGAAGVEVVPFDPAARDVDAPEDLA